MPRVPERRLGETRFKDSAYFYPENPILDRAGKVIGTLTRAPLGAASEYLRVSWARKKQWTLRRPFRIWSEK